MINKNDRIYKLLLCNSIEYSLKRKMNVVSAYHISSCMVFSLSYLGTYDNLSNQGYKELLLKLCISNYSDIDKNTFNSDIYNYKENVFDNDIDKYKKRIDDERNLFYSKDYFKENTKIYNSLDEEDKVVISELLLLFYDNIDEAFNYDKNLLSYIDYVNKYIEKVKDIFDSSFINKISNIKLFSLGIYSKDDYKLITDYVCKLKREVNYEEFDDKYNKHIDDIGMFHDCFFNIKVSKNYLRFVDSFNYGYTFNNCEVLNYDDIKNIDNSSLEGYSYESFRYKNGRYLSAFSFSSDDLIIVEYDGISKEEIIDENSEFMINSSVYKENVLSLKNVLDDNIYEVISNQDANFFNLYIISSYKINNNDLIFDYKLYFDEISNKDSEIVRIIFKNAKVKILEDNNEITKEELENKINEQKRKFQEERKKEMDNFIKNNPGKKATYDFDKLYNLNMKYPYPYSFKLVNNKIIVRFKVFNNTVVEIECDNIK